MTQGEKRAWECLGNLDPLDVSKRAGVYYDHTNRVYLLRSFCFDFSVSTKNMEITSLTPDGESLIAKYGYFFNISTLCYLINSKDIPRAGRFVGPQGVLGGALFFRGTHMLPMDKIAEKYGADKSGFIRKGNEMGGKIMDYGDASVELLPLPRIPVTLVLWLCDDEFPSRADLLFDSTCEQHLPLDIIWSVAMLSLLAML